MDVRRLLIADSVYDSAEGSAEVDANNNFLVILRCLDGINLFLPASLLSYLIVQYGIWYCQFLFSLSRSNKRRALRFLLTLSVVVESLLSVVCSVKVSDSA